VTDSDLLHVIIQNLLSNAVKYTPEKGTVTVTLQKADAGSVIDGKTIGQDSLLISVQDTGIGIPVKDQDKIFGKFFRSENAVKNSPNGNGLGLYMTKIMADIIGNTVWFSSEEGKGTTFFLLVPKETRMVV